MPIVAAPRTQDRDNQRFGTTPRYSRIQVAAAREELARLEKLRAIDQAAHIGRPQTAIAMEAGISQAEVSRIIKRIKFVPSMLERFPREVVLEAVAGQITHAKMMDELRNWDYSYARDAEPQNPLSVRTSGSWDQVTEAFHRGLIDSTDYEFLQQRIGR